MSKVITPHEGALTKEDIPFLVQAMDRKFQVQRKKVALAAAPAVGAADKVAGDMSVPKPVTVDVAGTMTQEDYKKCSMIMAVCQNMVQKSLTDAATEAGVPAADALKNMNAWVQAYVAFPLPIFNFIDSQSDDYKKNDFSLTADPDVVEKVVNIKDVQGLKDAVVGALKSSGGNLASYAGTDRAFNYFGVITGYNATNISARVIKFKMNLKTTNVDSLCVHYSKTNLDTSYDTYQFVADKEMMIKLQDRIGSIVVDYIAKKLFDFVTAFYDQELADYHKMLVGMFKK